jgi:hypothetical protein
MDRAAKLLAGDLKARDELANALWRADGYVGSVLDREDCHTQDMRERADAVVEWLRGEG